MALNIRYLVSLVGWGSSVVGAPLRNLGKFVYPHCMSVSFGSYTISRLALLYGVYARGSKISHTGGKCIICP